MKYYLYNTYLNLNSQSYYFPRTNGRKWNDCFTFMSKNDDFIRLDSREWLGFDEPKPKDDFISLDSREWLGFDEPTNSDDEFISLDSREWLGFDEPTNSDDEFISLDSREWLGFDEPASSDDEFISLDSREWLGFDEPTNSDDEFISLDSREWLGFGNEYSDGYGVFANVDSQINRFDDNGQDTVYAATGFDTSMLNQVQQQVETAAALA